MFPSRHFFNGEKIIKGSPYPGMQATGKTKKKKTMNMFVLNNELT